MLYLFLFSSILIGQAQQAPIFIPPPSFEVDDLQLTARFVDFGWAQYEMFFDVEKKKVSVETHIVFRQWEEGAPLFDLTSEPQEVVLDGEVVKTKLVKTPDKETSLRIILTTANVGEHHLIIKNKITKNIKFGRGSASAAFWYSDLDDREFLEQYVPTNFEYDQYAMSFKVHLLEATEAHRIFTNGRVQLMDENNFQVFFPETYNCASPFFHFGPSDDFNSVKNIYKSVDGRELPVVVYTKDRLFFDADIDSYMDTALQTLSELEKDYGAFPHQSLLVYAAPNFGGGMEYAGATITDHWALPHEITHSYFGRGLMPANGNAGWIDEALASWRDKGYQRREEPGYDSGRLASFSPYRRTTTRDAYTKGRDFMSYIDSLIATKNPGSGLKSFMRETLSQHVFQVISTGFFRSWLEKNLESSLQDDFDQYVYGKNGIDFFDPLEKTMRNPHHPKMDEVSLRPWL